MAARYRQQLATVDALGRAEGEVLVPPREYAARPTFTPDGREVVWADSDGYTRPQLRRLAVSPGSGARKERPRTLLLVDGAGGSTFTRDGRTLYFGAEEVYRTVYGFNDLFALDVATGEKRQLTHGLRATEPDLSPDGRTIAFAVNEAGSRSLETLDVQSGARSRLVGNLHDLSQVYTPAWSPDGKMLAFSWWRDGGYRDIWTIDVATRELRRVTFDRALDLDPRFSPDGRYLYFCSDRTGIYNLFAYELATDKTWQVTNVLGGVFDPAISPDGRQAVYVGFAADGYVLARIDLDPARFRPASPALIDRPDADVPAGEAHLQRRPYQPWRTAWPHRFNLSWGPDGFGQTITLGLNGGDVVGHHLWSTDVTFSLARADDIGAGFSYYYTRFFPAFSLSGYRILALRGGQYIDGVNHAYVEEDWSASATVDLPILRRIDRAADLSFGYNLAYLRNEDRNKVPLDPNLISPRLPEEGRVASFGIGYDYYNLHRYTFSVSAEEGRTVGLHLGVSLKGIGSQYNVVTASWYWTEFVPLWSIRGDARHVLALSYAGGISGGDITHRGVFFLGGYAPQPDLLRSAFDFTRPGGASLRGYPWGSVYGNQMEIVNAEYRFPIVWIERGYETFPVYVRRLHGAVFADYGNAFDGTFHPSELKLGVGAELRLEVNLAYYFPAALQFGYAHGFMSGGESQWYFYLNNPF
jgi:hypothetical protein